MSRLLRGVFIVWVVLRHGLDDLVLSGFDRPWLKALRRVVSLGRNLDAPRGQRLREALEQLGPIFVKFGQVLSTRRDLLPPDIADELTHLQDRVPPFSSKVAVETIERAFGKPLDAVFTDFEHVPVASASIAQVHFATLRDGRHGGREVAVKVLRPNMLRAIEKDLSLMRMMAGWVERLSADGKRLKPRKWWPSSTNTFTMSWIWYVKRPMRPSFVATCRGWIWSWFPKCSGTIAIPK